MAQMVSKAAQSEMRIGLNTSAFGSVEVRAVVHATDIGVTIGSEKGDLRSLLVNDLPGIAHTLQQHDLRLSEVSFHQQGFAFSSDSSAGGQAQPRSFAERRNPEQALPSDPSAAEPGATPQPSSRSGGLRLSILA